MTKKIRTRRSFTNKFKTQIVSFILMGKENIKLLGSIIFQLLFLIPELINLKIQVLLKKRIILNHWKRRKLKIIFIL